jgi:outer membrane receptor protein involved in Fe transport
VGRAGFSWSLGASRTEFGTRDVAGVGQSADGLGGITSEDRIAPSSYESQSFDTKLLWAPTASSEWMFSAQSFEAPDLPRYNEVVPGFGTAAAGQADAALSEYDNARHFAHLRYRARFESGRLQWVELHLARQIVVDDRFDRSLDLTTDARERNRSTLDGFTAMGHAALSPTLAITFGADFYRDAIRSSRADTRGGVTVVNGPNTSVKSRFPDGATSDSLGVYANAGFTPAGAWHFDGSVRADRVVVELPIADRLSGGRFADTALSGGVGASRSLDSTWSWHTNLRHGFRAPNVNDLAQIGRRTNNRIVIANTALTPESLWSLDTGLRGTGQSWSAEAAVFYSRYRDRITLIDTGVIYANGVNGCNRAGGCLEAQSRNIARAKYYGFEGGVRYKANRLGLAATLNYTFGDQTIADVATPANRVPPLNGVLSLSWRASDSLDAELRGWFAGRQSRLDPSDLRDNRIDPSGTPGYTAVDAALAWRPSESLVLRFSGRNLLDRDYREHGSGIDATGRSLVVSAQYRFGAR